MRDDSVDEYGIIGLQDLILEIMVYIDSICNEFNIDYCLAYGSALGARRHAGFIPWDDDIDIFMTAREYGRFRQAFSSAGDKEKYYLQEYGLTHIGNQDYVTTAKLRMNGTFIDEPACSGFKIHKGVFVDIFILHNLAESEFGRIRQFIWSKFVVLKGLQLRKYVGKSIAEKLMLKAISLFPRNWLLRKGLKIVYKYDEKETSCCMEFIGTREFRMGIFPVAVFKPSVITQFEKVKLRIPADNDAYLRHAFGDDYLELPPVEKREINKHGARWGFCDENFSFDDEYKLI